MNKSLQSVTRITDNKIYVIYSLAGLPSPMRPHYQVLEMQPDATCNRVPIIQATCMYTSATMLVVQSH